MRKQLNTSFVYMIIGLVFGVFYREFTKYLGFTGRTSLSVLHTHTLILGMVMFLIVLVLDKQFNLVKEKKFNRFYILYNLGLVMTLIMLFIRGLADVEVITLTKGLNAAISGIAGLAHIILAAGLFTFFTILRKKIKA